MAGERWTPSARRVGRLPVPNGSKAVANPRKSLAFRKCMGTSRSGDAPSLTSAVRGVASRVSGHLAEKSALHSRYRRRHQEALREAPPEPIEQDRLGLVRTDHAAETERARRLSGERQHHVGALDASQFVEDRPWAVAEPGLRLPLLEGLPEHVGQEADEDVRLDALGLLVPDRPDREFTLVDAEGRLDLP